MPRPRRPPAPPAIRRGLALAAIACSTVLRCALPAAEAGALPAMARPEITVAPGFAVERVYAVPREAAGSWVSLAADSRGRMYAGDQYGALYRIVPGATPSAPPAVTKVPLPIGGVHGLTWFRDHLYAVVGQKAVCATGLYRLRDTDGDGELDQVELLRGLDGDGEHGPHAVVPAPDGRALYVIAGNGTRLPALVRSRVPRLWREDSLLAPLPALMGSESRGLLPGGWICRTDLDGREWELVCVGLRNAYALACDANGELFAFDSDTEFEVNLPWYRPTRVLHAVSGADFGWRGGALKIPEAAPDTWPALLPMGLGSPTAVLFAPTARVPAPWRDALWVADWSYGRIYALQLRPAGASFTATRTEVVAGMPLPVTAMCVNPGDGAIYFTTGGRRLHAGLYRLSWTGDVGRAETPTAPPSAAAAQRVRLEASHGRIDPAAIEAAWPLLGSDDRLLRNAARTAIESQPMASWRERALAESSPRAALTALLALARVDAGTQQAALLDRLRRLEDDHLVGEWRGDWLRVLSLTLSRGGRPPAAEGARWAERLSPLLAEASSENDAAVLELLVYFDAPDAARKGVALLRRAATREAGIEAARSLRGLRAGWTPELRRGFFEWLGAAQTWRGGATFGPFVQRLRDDALATAPEGERAAWRELLASRGKQATDGQAAEPPRAFVREWTVDDLMKLSNDGNRRDPARGRRVFAQASCFACHSFDGEGGAVGPDLSAVTRRLALRDLYEAMLEPSRAVSDQYGTAEIRVRDGRVLIGRIVNLTETGLSLAENLLEPAKVVRLATDDVLSIEASKQSLMPPGLLNAFSGDEILDLVAFLRGGR